YSRTNGQATTSTFAQACSDRPRPAPLMSPRTTSGLRCNSPGSCDAGKQGKGCVGEAGQANGGEAGQALQYAELASVSRNEKRVRLTLHSAITGVPDGGAGETQGIAQAPFRLLSPLHRLRLSTLYESL